MFCINVCTDHCPIYCVARNGTVFSVLKVTGAKFSSLDSWTKDIVESQPHCCQVLAGQQAEAQHVT